MGISISCFLKSIEAFGAARGHQILKETDTL